MKDEKNQQQQQQQTIIVHQQTYVCIQCNEDTGRNGYDKTQWSKKGQGVCKRCWKKIKKANEIPNGSLVSVQCESCRQPFDTTKKGKKENMEKKCQPCIEKEKQKCKEDYWNIPYGVGYEDGSFTYDETQPLTNEKLIGKYKLIFYSSDCGCTYNDKPFPSYVHRTAKGTLELSIKEWDNEPALYGIYKVDSYIDDIDDHHLAGTMIEYVKTNFNVDDLGNGFNILCGANEEYKSISTTPGCKYFIVDRDCPYYLRYYKKPKRYFWETIQDDANNCDLDTYCGATIQIISKQVALGLEPDKIRSYKYIPTAATSYKIANKEDNIEQARILMDKYHDISNYWICKYLNIPTTKVASTTTNVAMRIREYITPPPVLYINPGDIVLSIEESKECEWDIRMIFRKIE